MGRRIGRKKTFQIRIDADCKNKLDQLRGNLSYNQYINHFLIANQQQIEKYKLCSKLISKIDQGDRPFRWEYDRLVKYVEEHESKRI